MSDTPFSLTAEQRSTILERLFTLLQDHYVFPEVTKQVQETLHQRLYAGDYDKVTTTDVFCELITEHLYEVSHDRHLSLWYRADAQPFSEGGNLSTDPEWQKTFRQEAILQNFGFQRVERLTGNIGYLDLRSFFPPEFAGDTAVAVMAFLAHTNALIIDLRSNDGGENYMAHLLSSYLFEGEPLLLNSFYLRPLQSTQQCWTLPYIPGKRYVEKPVYVLTGPRTASAAEEFAYTLQHLKRVVVVGERTMGAANPIEHYQITSHVAAYIPIGRAINAVTGINWEGTGVIPDREVPAATALQVAHLEAVQNVLKTLKEKASPQAYSTFEKEARGALRELLSVERKQE